MSQQIPPWLQEQIKSFQQSRDSLQNVVMQIQHLKTEQHETQRAQEELQQAAGDQPVYRQAGPVLIRAERDRVLSELGDSLELANTRLIILEKQKGKLEGSLREQEARINEALRGGAYTKWLPLHDIRIVADERERKSGIPDMLKKAGLDLDIKTLQVGDYIVASETVVERKSVQDMVSSVFDGRLFDQCSRLKEHFERPVLVLEGDFEGLEGIVENPLVFYGALSAVVLDHGIPVLPTPNAGHTVRLLISMAAKRKTAPVLKKIRKHSDVQRQQLTVLSSLPGVGETLAGRMLGRFGTPMGALAAPTADLSKVQGVGRSRAEKIRKMLDRQLAESDGDQRTL